MKSFLFIVGVLTTPLLIVAAEKPVEICAAGEAAVLEVNGTKLTLADLEHENPGLMFQARNLYYEAQKKALDAFVDDYLLEQQAKAEKLTVSQLLEKHVNSTIAKDPSEESLRVYYEGLDTTQPYEAIRGQIIDALRQRRIARAKAAYLKTLHGAANIAVLLNSPRAQISLEQAEFRGPKAAAVTVVEYADYECPYCQQAQPVLEKLETTYKGKIAFVFKDMPLPMHKYAEKAAEASRCAEAQSKYWQYHDMLFADKQLELPALRDDARKLNLNAEAFNKCLDSGTTAGEIRASSEEAQGLGVQGTPTIFINGKLYADALSYDKLQAAIEEELQKAKSTPAAQMASR